MTSLDTRPPKNDFKQFKDAKFPLICTFGLPGEKNNVFSIGKWFKLRWGTKEQAMP